MPQARGEAVSAASLTAVQRGDDSVFSYTVWSEGTEILLPKAQYVVFYDADSDGASASGTAQMQFLFNPDHAITPNLLGQFLNRGRMKFHFDAAVFGIDLPVFRGEVRLLTAGRAPGARQ